MTKNVLADRVRTSRRFSLASLLHRAVTTRHPPMAPLFDALESRQLLSAAWGHLAALGAHPFFVEYHPATGTAPAAIQAAATEVTPSQMRIAYGVNNLSVNGIVGNGAGQTIAIVDAFCDPTLAADLVTFD